MNVHQFFITFLGLALFINAMGQSAEIRTYGGPFFDEARQVIEVDDGYLLVGTTASANQGNSDIYVLRINDELEPVWMRTLGGAASEQGRSACLANNGDFMILGQTPAGPFGGYDLVVYRLSPSGETLWERHYGTNDWDLATRIVKGVSMFYIASTSFGFSPGDSRQWLFRINDEGEVISESTYDVWPRSEVNDLIWHDHALYLIGTRQFPGGTPQGILRKVTPTGAVVWEHVEDSTSFQGRSVSIGEMGVSAAFAKTDPTKNDTWDMFLVNMTTDGEYIAHEWSNPPLESNQVPNSITSIDVVSIQVATTDGYGDGPVSCFVNRISTSGIFQSAIIIYGDHAEEPYSIIADSQGRIVFVGYSTSYGNDFPDALLVRFPNKIILGNYDFNFVHYIEDSPFTAVEDAQQGALLKPWPNPAGRQLNFPSGTTKWVMSTTSGIEVGYGLGERATVIHLPAGLYVVQFEVNNQWHTSRIVVE